jgi:CheY-like chemotaxis protein
VRCIYLDRQILKPMSERKLGRPKKTLKSGGQFASRTRRQRVLLIEDHAELAEATAEFMRSEGLEVRIAPTGNSGLEMAEAFQPEIVLCDISLPDMSGLDVARALRAIPATKDTLIAMHTALGERDLRTFERQTDGWVDLFLSKPLTPEKLDTILSQLNVLRRSRGFRRRPT